MCIFCNYIHILLDSARLSSNEITKAIHRHFVLPYSRHYRARGSKPSTLSGKRDAALLSVGYDTLCRSSELSWIRVDDVCLKEARIYIPRSKSDPFGDGRFAKISEQTSTRLHNWLIASQLRWGFLFRGLHTGKVSQQQLETSSIRRILKASAKRAGLNAEARDLSGHSMRVGAAQDLLRAGYDTLTIMCAGGWKNIEVVSRYVEGAAPCVIASGSKPVHTSMASTIFS